MLKRLLLALVVVSLVFSCNQTTKPDDGTLQVTVLSFNDFHGALTENGANDKNMGGSKLLTAINTYKQVNPDTLVVSAGDNYNGTALSNLLYGKPVSELMKMMGVRASAVGNHEFDWGIDKIGPWAKEGGFNFVAANIVDKATGKAVPWAKPYVIETTSSGVKVAFIGLTTQETAYKTNPLVVNGLEFKDPVETAKTYVKEVKAKGANIVILLTHIGSWQDADGTVTLEPDTMDLSTIEGVDAIITGHSHQPVAGFLNGTPVVQAYYNGRSLGVLNFIVGNNSHTLIETDVSVDSLYTHKADFADNSEASAMINTYSETMAPELNEVVGFLPEALEHDRFMLSPLGMWVAEVMRVNGEGDMAFTNGGGLRTSLPAGDITMGNLYEVMPFDNMVSIFNMSGRQIKEVLEHGINNKEIGDVQYAGLNVVLNGNNQVQSVTLANGEPLQDDKIYRVVTNDFMATGGDGFSSFLQAEYLGDTVGIRDVMKEALAQ